MKRFNVFVQFAYKKIKKIIIHITFDFRMVTTQGLRRSAATTFSSPSVVALVLVVFLSLFLSLAEGNPAGVRNEGRQSLA